MTVSTSLSTVTYQGNGATTVFPFTFFVDSTAHLVVQITDTSVTPNVTTTLTVGQYSAVLSGSGGTVTYTPALPTTKKITISRVLPYVQATDLNNQDGFYADTVESALDYVTMLTQQLNALVANLTVTSGNVPQPILAQVGYVLYANAVNGFSWADPASIGLAGLNLKMDKSANLSDVASPSSARANLSLGAAALLATATAAQFRANSNTGALANDQVWAAAAEVAVTWASTIALDFSTFLNASITLAGNTTLSAPTNVKAGQSGCIRLIQDATGSRTVTWNAKYLFSGGSDFVASTAANAVDVVYYFSPDGVNLICTGLAAVA